MMETAATVQRGPDEQVCPTLSTAVPQRRGVSVGCCRPGSWDAAEGAGVVLPTSARGRGEPSVLPLAACLAPPPPLSRATRDGTGPPLPVGVGREASPGN